MIHQTICELHRLFVARELRTADLADSYLSEIQRLNPHYQAISTFSETGFRLLADVADQALASTEPLKRLAGIPILIDDLIDVANMRTTYGCQAYSAAVPEMDAMVVRRLRAAGALIPGKVTTSELGLMREEDADQFVCRSPWGERYVSGGGASGSSVGVVKNFAAAAIAVDIGGNALLPSIFSGLCALVPTYGRVAHTPIYSRGLMFASVAIITRDVKDCALLMDVVAGESEVDPLSVRLRQSNYLTAIERPIRGLSVALVNALWNAPFDDAHSAAILNVRKFLKSAGCRVESRRPPIRNAHEAWKTITRANLHVNHGDALQRQPEKFGAMAAEWIEKGAAVSAADYIDAQKQIFGLRALLRTFFCDVDLLIVSAAGCVPFEYGAVPSNLQAGYRPTSWQDYASMCIIGAVSGFPVAHLPMGLSKEGLPVGVFIIARPGDEDLLLALSAKLEKSAAVCR